MNKQKLKGEIHKLVSELELTIKTLEQQSKNEFNNSKKRKSKTISINIWQSKKV
jgi:hypothetical protein